MEFHNPALLPLVPERLRRAHHVYEPLDTRFKAAARLKQALWRERQQLGVGNYVARNGAKRRLGSMLAPQDAHAVVGRHIAK